MPGTQPTLTQVPPSAAKCGGPCFSCPQRLEGGRKWAQMFIIIPTERTEGCDGCGGDVRDGRASTVSMRAAQPFRLSDLKAGVKMAGFHLGLTNGSKIG